MRVLIIEDELPIAADLCEYLESRGHLVDSAQDGVTGLHLALTQDFDAILLDVNLPRMSGLTLCSKLRTEGGRDTPVLMLTARDTLDQKLEGFEHGADDYLVKPFALKEVEARLTALHKRRAGRVARKVLQVGELLLDSETLAVSYRGQPVRLPPKGLRLLETLMAQPNRVFSRQDLEAAVWGEVQFNSDPLRTQMHTLRRALVAAGGSDPIENVHGLGYRLGDGH
jgi:DNA-binding response OmpR family regulator